MLSEVIRVPIDEATKNRLVELANSEGRKLANMSRVLIREALEARQPDDTDPDDKRLNRKSAKAAA